MAAQPSPRSTTAPERTRTVPRVVALADILPSPHNVRARLTDLDDLAASIRQHGVLQPPTLVPDGDGFRVIMGHRRCAAAKRAGLTQIPALVRVHNRSDETALMLVENLQRADLDPIDAAKGLSRLAQDRSIPEVARMVGMSQATVRARISLLDLPAEAQRMLKHKQMSLGDAVSLAKQVRSRGTGSARVGSRRSTTCAFGASHPLAGHVRARCTHADTTRRMLGPGCAECWEATIREDALGTLAITPVTSLAKSTTGHAFDESAVQRALGGDLAGLTLTVGDREECVRRLVTEGLSDAQIGTRINTTGRTVERIRRRLGIDPAIAPSRPREQAS